jgi:HAD superfamily hydrolase (TIGR01549 family)
MDTIKGIGFDLFDTLISVESEAFKGSFEKLMQSLKTNGFNPDEDAFRKTYREEAVRFMTEAKKSGRETHNRFWIHAALQRHGYDIQPDDRRIEEAICDYFSVFISFSRLIPDVIAVLSSLKDRYRLGLLSNFTHAPTVRRILDHHGLSPFFDVILISDEIGYRKPHPAVFENLVQQLDLDRKRILFVGDDPEADVGGAEKAGLRPVWMTYVRDTKTRLAENDPKTNDRIQQIKDSKTPVISRLKDLLTMLTLTRVDSEMR